MRFSMLDLLEQLNSAAISTKKLKITIYMKKSLLFLIIDFFPSLNVIKDRRGFYNNVEKERVLYKILVSALEIYLFEDIEIFRKLRIGSKKVRNKICSPGRGSSNDTKLNPSSLPPGSGWGQL